MSGNFRVKSMNLAESEQRLVLVPAENSPMTVVETKKSILTTNKQHKKVEKSPETKIEKKQAKLTPTLSPTMKKSSSPSILRHGSQLLRGNLSMNGSCSSEASSDSSYSMVSTGRSSRSSVPCVRRKLGLSKVENVGVNNEGVDEGLVCELDGFLMKKRCAWVTPSNDPSYVSFHDDDWGVPVHDDNKLFELLSLSVALAELTWPTILNKRSTFREVFSDFDPVTVSKLNERKVCGPGTPASSLLSELKLRNIFENARQVCKIKNEFGSFGKYIWGFMNHKPIVNKFRYARQVPVKTSKAEVISKDLVRRGFRGVGPTVVYSFMQAAGLTNDHLITCFRYRECVGASEGTEKDEQATIDVDKPIDMVDLELIRGLDELSISSD
ncbi:hypothetical protein RND81_11G136000 [Saponaria officinalis]|uniref:DNA-3-methyladenine glycosylase I n=1 Tax=Saponaria officinalis TaxID=3572 RepID=A0AAW1HLR0_SAPOF